MLAPVKVCIFCFLALLSASLFASITIDSISTRSSSCVNNGGISVFAHTSSPPLLFTLVDGPQLAPYQNTGIFTDLLPGVYEMQVTNFNNEADTLFLSVFGNYQYPQFTTAVTNTSCGSEPDGSIFCTLAAQTGHEPFSWKLTNNITGISQPSNNGGFTNLLAGNYTITLSDSCQNTTLQNVTIAGTASSLNLGVITNTITACYTTTVSFAVYVQPSDSTNFTLKISTKNGTYTQAANYNQANNTITESIANVGYGDTVNITVYNTCGDSAVNFEQIPPFSFQPQFNTWLTNCNQLNTNVSFTLNNTYLANPVTYSVTDSATGFILSQSTLNNVEGIGFYGGTAGHTYNVKITDGCGNVFNTQCTWPVDTLPTPSVNAFADPAFHCLDSTSSVNIICQNFTDQPTVVLLSGPSSVSCTQAGYAFTDTYQYGANVPPTESNYFIINNLTAGTYTFKVTDACGYNKTDTFVVTPQSLADDHYKVSFIRGCSGENKLLVNLYTHIDTALTRTTTGKVIITNLQTGNIISNNTFYYTSQFQHSITDTISHLPAGRYTIEIDYTPINGLSPYNPTQHLSCWSIFDTITIPPYQRPSINTAAEIKCHGNTYIQFLVDSTKGVFPFKYAVTAGPQTFPSQTSNIFNINQTGSYTAQITDSCGYTNTLNFSVDTFSFPNVFKFGSSCLGGKTALFYPASPFLQYFWQSPSGSVYAGDTLTIYPTSLSDLGLYHITKVVTINGCVDTFSTTYTLTQGAESYLFDTICKGGSFTFAGRNLTATGIYHDTINGVTCDSIVNLYLTVDYRRDTIFDTICPGNSYTFNNHSYNQTGFYSDTLNAACSSIHSLLLNVRSYRRSSSTVFACPGNPYSFNGRVLTQTGIYRDTIPGPNCDSIATLYFGVTDYLRSSNSFILCAGKTLHVGTHTYYQTGIYVDTLSNASGCDSIVTSSLTVNLYPADTLNDTICNGDVLKFGHGLYYTAGAYTDTFSYSGCDTIYTILLAVLPSPVGDTATQVYQMEYGDTLQLLACAMDSLYLWNAGSCLNCSEVKVAPNVLTANYQCKVTNNYGCSITCHYEVNVHDLYGDIFVPNAFTPDGNGINDIFKVIGKNIKVAALYVFNRWGEKVFESTNVNDGWDGTFKGKPSPAGVYTYTLQYFGGIDDKAKALKGSITLIR